MIYNFYNEENIILDKEKMFSLLHEYAKTRDKNKRDLIISNNIKFVLKIVNDVFYNYKHLEDDMVSVGTLSLIIAIEKYDENKCHNFFFYLKTCITNSILRFLQKNNITYLDINDEIHDSLSFSSKNIVPFDLKINEKLDKQKAMEEIREALIKIDEKQQLVIRMFYGIGLEQSTQQEIANIFGITQSYVNKLIKRGLLEINDIIVKQRAINSILSVIDRIELNSQNFIKLYYGINCEEKTIQQIGKLYNTNIHYVKNSIEKGLNEISQILDDDSIIRVLSQN